MSLSCECCVFSGSGLCDELITRPKESYRLWCPTYFPFKCFFLVQGTGGSPTEPDPENRVGDQDTISPGRPVASGLQMPGEPFSSWSG
jgi:hypothetical protein